MVSIATVSIYITLVPWKNCTLVLSKEGAGSAISQISTPKPTIEIYVKIVEKLYQIFAMKSSSGGKFDLKIEFIFF